MAPSGKKAATHKATEKVVNPAPPVVAAATATTTALAKNMQQGLAPTASMPAWLAKMVTEAVTPQRGFEEMDAADYILPRLVLAQSMTPEVVNAKANGLGIEVGDIFDNLTKMILCKNGETLEIIPVILGKSRMLFGDFNKGEKVLCRSDDALTSRKNGRGQDEGGVPTTDCTKCVNREFDEEKGKPMCSLLYNIIVLLPAFDLQAYVWSNKHVSVKVAKRFLSTARQMKTDMFAQRYELHSVVEKNDRFTYQNFEFKPLGWVAQDQYRAAEGFFSSLEGKTWAPNTEDIEKEVVSDREPGSDDGDDGPTVEGTATNVAPTPPGATKGEEAF